MVGRNIWRSCDLTPCSNMATWNRLPQTKSKLLLKIAIMKCSLMELPVFQTGAIAPSCPVKIPLEGSTSLWWVSHYPQLHVRHRFTEGALYSIVQTVNEDAKQDWTQYWLWNIPLYTDLQLDFGTGFKLVRVGWIVVPLPQQLYCKSLFTSWQACKQRCFFPSLADDLQHLVLWWF